MQSMNQRRFRQTTWQHAREGGYEDKTRLLGMPHGLVAGEEAMTSGGRPLLALTSHRKQ